MWRGQWVKGVRSDPKGAMEADLVILVVGVISIMLGGLVAVAGVHGRQSTDNAGNPIFGNIIAAVGLLVVVIGLVLGIANLVIWWTGRRGQNLAKPQTDDERTLAEPGRRYSEQSRNCVFRQSLGL